MGEPAWWLKKFGDFIYLLNCYAEGEKDVLQRRFKKDGDAKQMLYDLIDALDGLGFDKALEYGRTMRRIKTISNSKHLSLIELRVGSTLWRVVTYVDYERKAFVMIDAFQHHKAKKMNDVVEQNEANIRRAMELLGKVG